MRVSFVEPRICRAELQCAIDKLQDDDASNGRDLPAHCYISSWGLVQLNPQIRSVLPDLSAKSWAAEEEAKQSDVGHKPNLGSSFM